MAGFFDIFSDSGDTFFEAIQKFIVDSDKYLTDAFASSNIDDSWWAAVVGTANHQGMLATWMPILAPFLVLLVTVQVVQALISGSSMALARAAFGAVGAFPATYMVVWAVMAASAAVDEMTVTIMGNGADSTAGVFIKILGLQVENGQITGVAEGYYMWDGLIDKAGGWQLLGALMLSFIIWLMSLILGFVMSLRSMVIVILAATAGWAVVALTFEMTKSWFSSWMQMMVGLLLAKPFAAAVIIMSQDIFNYANSSSQFFAGLVGMFLGICMPFVAIRLFSFSSAGSIGDLDNSMMRSVNTPVQGLRGQMRRRRRR